MPIVVDAWQFEDRPDRVTCGVARDSVGIARGIHVVPIRFVRLPLRDYRFRPSIYFDPGPQRRKFLFYNE